jgi:hypothetical protein
MARVSPQLICFSYHKSGTSLLLHVMTKISARLGLRLANHFGLVEHLDPEPDIVLLPHSVLRGPLDRPYRAIRMIRDPRDIWVSGYLYHRRCIEEWCVNTDLNPTPPILWPRVDHSVAHWPEDWKRRYIDRLNGRSYQANLLQRSQEDGFAFELDGYTGWTLATMAAWSLNHADALDVKLEDVMADFDGAMLRIFDHFGFTAEQNQAALEVAGSEDIRRMDDAAIADRPQITSRTISKWREMLSAAQIARFEARYGDLIRSLGYEGADVVPPDVDVWLSADGAVIRPAAAGSGTFSFAVPPGQERIVLESRCRAHPATTRRLGVLMSEIVIRSDAGEVVIAADDPRLRAGWYDAEREGAVLGRWTSGSGELPWGGVTGPSIVTIRCQLVHNGPASDAKNQL